MRFLGEDEKKIVTKLSRDGYQFFSDLFDKDFLKDLIIKFTNDIIYERYEIKFLIKKSSAGQNQQEVMEKATEKIVQTINLIEYLKSNAYLFSFKPAHRTPVEGTIGLKEVVADYQKNSENYVGMQYPDEKTYELIFEYLNIVFVSSEALRYYVKKGFRTEEQIRHRQNLIVAWVAIGISIVLGLIGIFSWKENP